MFFLPTDRVWKQSKCGLNLVSHEMETPVSNWGRFLSLKYSFSNFVFMNGHLGHVTINICYKFTPLNLRSRHIRFEFNWPSGFWENYVLIYWWDSNMSEFGWKVNLDLWNLSIAIVSLGLMYQVRIMTLASTVFKKSTFQKITNLNALGSKFDLDFK